MAAPSAPERVLIMGFSLAKFRRLPESTTKEWHGDEEPVFVQSFRLAVLRKRLHRRTRDLVVAASAFSIGWVLALGTMSFRHQLLALILSSVTLALASVVYFWRLVRTVIEEQDLSQSGNTIKTIEMPAAEEDTAEAKA